MVNTPLNEPRNEETGNREEDDEWMIEIETDCMKGVIILLL